MIDRAQLVEVIRNADRSFLDHPVSNHPDDWGGAIAAAVLALVGPEMERLADELNCAMAERKMALAELDRLRARAEPQP